MPEAEYLDLINEKLVSRTDTTGDLKDGNKEGRTTPRNVKDSTPSKDGIVKKEKKSDTEDITSNDDKKEAADLESEGKKGKQNKEIKTRGKRNIKDKRTDEDQSTSRLNELF